MDFLGLLDTTQLDGFKPAPQEVAHLTNRDYQGRPSDYTTNRTAGGRITESPTNGEENGRETDGVRKYVQITTPQLGKMGPGPPW